MDLTRNQFLRLCAGAGVGALGLSALAACGKSEGKDPTDAPAGSSDAPPADAGLDGPPVDAPTAGNCMQNGTMSTIGTNHGHEMPVSIQDIMAAVEKTYQIEGTSGHPHSVTITGLMFMQLQQNIPIVVTSSPYPEMGGHTHPVTVRCA